MCGKTERWQEWLRERKGGVGRYMAGETGGVPILQGTCHVEDFGPYPNDCEKS